MHRFVTISVFALASFLISPPASAQEAGKIGVTMGFPESVGIVWHVTEAVAIRPELSFGWSSSDTEFSESSGRSFSTGLSALVYLRRWDSLATYVSPRYAYRRTRTTSESLFSEQTSKGDSHGVSGSFGAQYWLGDRFSAFGELGLGYTRNSSEIGNLGVAATSRSFATRTAVGVVFYF